MPNRALYRSFITSATQQIISGENPARTFFLAVNDGDADIYIMLGANAIFNEGIRLNANGSSYQIDKMNPWHGEIYAVGDATGPKLLTTEY